MYIAKDCSKSSDKPDYEIKNSTSPYAYTFFIHKLYASWCYHVELDVGMISKVGAPTFQQVLPSMHTALSADAYAFIMFHTLISPCHFH